MSEKSNEFRLCPSCGSTEYVENYPILGVSICEECGHEVASIVLKVIQDAEEENVLSKDTCPFCGAKNQTEDDNELFSDGSFNGVWTTVYKCGVCGKLNGYRILPPTFAFPEEVNEEGFNLKTVERAKREGQSIYSGPASKKIVKALKEKAKDPVELCQKLFQRIAEEKSLKMIEMGAEPRTIEEATWKVKNYIDLNGPLSEKQLECLFSAEITLAQEGLVNKGKFKGKKITEREMEEIFNVDRKTVRKWKKILKQKSK